MKAMRFLRKSTKGKSQNTNVSEEEKPLFFLKLPATVNSYDEFVSLGAVSDRQLDLPQGEKTGA